MRGDIVAYPLRLNDMWARYPITHAVADVLNDGGLYKVAHDGAVAEFELRNGGELWGRFENQHWFQMSQCVVVVPRPAETMLQANRERLDDLRPAKSCETCRFGLRGANGPFCTNPLVVGHGQAGYVRGVDASDPWPSAVELCGKVEKFWWRPVRPWWMRWKEWF